MPKVALFSTRFLEYSQTFVFDEIRAHERYQVEVFCKGRLNRDRFPWEPVHEGGALYAATGWHSGFARAIGSGRFSLLHAHFGPAGVYAMRYAKRFDLPLVVTFHGYDVPILSSPERFRLPFLRYALFGRRLLGRMTLGLCASAELLEMLVALGVPRERLRLHHIGIDVEKFRPGERRESDPVDVVMVGRLVEKKGFEYGIRAFAAATKDRAVRLTLVGDGELEGRLRALAADLGVKDRVAFAGVLSSQDVAARLSTADVLLAPSVVARGGNRESGLLAVKEASAAGTVPIGTRHGGIPEIIDDGTTGFLVPERDVPAMADRLSQLLRDAPLRRAMSQRGRDKMVREYDNKERVRALEARYDEAVGRSRGA